MTTAREPALEAAIRAAPDDPFARRVYGDWLAERGEWLGEWVALAAACEAAPDDVHLRGSLVSLLGERRAQILGEPGGELLTHGWIGWRGGFVDEIRLVRGTRERSRPEPYAARVAALLAHPSAQFVRTIGVGDFRTATPSVVAAIAAAAPPCLDTLVALDAIAHGTEVSLNEVVEVCAPTLRRLGLRNARLEVPAPNVTELVISHAYALAWLAEGPCPALAELTIEGLAAIDPAELERVLAQAPALHTLRLVGAGELAAILPVVLRHAGRLRVLDLSHADFTPDHAAAFAGIPTLALVSSPMLQGGSLAAASEEPDDETWIARRLGERGRDALALCPGIGIPLYDIGTNRVIGGDFAGGLRFLEAARTFPSARVGSMAWANAAIAHEKLLHLDRAALLAREALLRAPHEPNFYAILVDALRRSGRLADALAELPRAYAALDARDTATHSEGAAVACLLDCLLALAQAGRHDEILRLADDDVSGYAALFESDAEAVLAMAHTARGDHAAAAASLVAAGNDAKTPVIYHARAVVALHGTPPDPEAALAYLRELRDASYTEWRWVATDPNLDPLRADPGFRALLS